MFNVEIKLADDGEILARGPNIMRGYWKDEKSTSEAINAEGWLQTGDVGTFTERGNLKITDRKKHLFVSSGGKNIAPLQIENEILRSRFVDQIMLIGDNREYCTALIVPDYELLKSIAHIAGFASDTPTSELLSNEKIVYEVMRDINEHQRDLAKYERVRKITLLAEPFTVDNAMMTPTLKIKRKVVEEHYKNVIDKMYQGVR